MTPRETPKVHFYQPKSFVYNRAFALKRDHGSGRNWTAEEDLLIRIAHAAGVAIAGEGAGSSAGVGTASLTGSAALDCSNST